MKIIFAGTPKFALSILKALIESTHEICAIYTQPDRPSGRGLKISASPVKEMALAADLPVYQPLSLKDDKVQKELEAFNADVFIDVAYGLLVPKSILETPRFGCINVHPSLLPKWRGAAPIQRAILAGEQITGVTIMQMDEGYDTGKILLQRSWPIEPNDTTGTLETKLAELGKKLLFAVLDKLASDKKIRAKTQNEKLSSYAAKISKEEARVDWEKSAIEIDRQTRAFNPWPIAYTAIDGQTIRIFKAHPLLLSAKVPAGVIIQSSKDGVDVATGNGVLRLVEMQLPGGKVLSVGEILNSKKELFKVGKIFDKI